MQNKHGMTHLLCFLKVLIHPSLTLKIHSKDVQSPYTLEVKTQCLKRDDCPREQKKYQFTYFILLFGEYENLLQIVAKF